MVALVRSGAARQSRAAHRRRRRRRSALPDQENAGPPAEAPAEEAAGNEDAEDWTAERSPPSSGSRETGRLCSDAARMETQNTEGDTQKILAVPESPERDGDSNAQDETVRWHRSRSRSRSRSDSRSDSNSRSRSGSRPRADCRSLFRTDRDRRSASSKVDSAEVAAILPAAGLDHSASSSSPDVTERQPRSPSPPGRRPVSPNKKVGSSKVHAVPAAVTLEKGAASSARARVLKVRISGSPASFSRGSASQSKAKLGTPKIVATPAATPSSALGATGVQPGTVRKPHVPKARGVTSQNKKNESPALVKSRNKKPTTSAEPPAAPAVITLAGDGDSGAPSGEAEYPCGVCGKETEGTRCVACDRCDVWHHLKCIHLGQRKKRSLERIDWFCSRCQPAAKEDKRARRSIAGE